LPQEDAPIDQSSPAPPNLAISIPFASREKDWTFVAVRLRHKRIATDDIKILLGEIMDQKPPLLQNRLNLCLREYSR
jgi:hypothetical protein